jgi:hypothetical protein
LRCVSESSSVYTVALAFQKDEVDEKCTCSRAREKKFSLTVTSFQPDGATIFCNRDSARGNKIALAVGSRVEVARRTRKLTMLSLKGRGVTHVEEALVDSI